MVWYIDNNDRIFGWEYGGCTISSGGDDGSTSDAGVSSDGIGKGSGK